MTTDFLMSASIKRTFFPSSAKDLAILKQTSVFPSFGTLLVTAIALILSPENDILVLTRL